MQQILLILWNTYIRCDEKKVIFVDKPLISDDKVAIKRDFITGICVQCFLENQERIIVSLFLDNFCGENRLSITYLQFCRK